MNFSLSPATVSFLGNDLSPSSINIREMFPNSSSPSFTPLTPSPMDFGHHGEQTNATISVDSRFLQTMSTFCAFFYGKEEEGKRSAVLMAENRVLQHQVSTLKDCLKDLDTQLSTHRVEQSMVSALKERVRSLEMELSARIVDEHEISELKDRLKNLELELSKYRVEGNGKGNAVLFHPGVGYMEFLENTRNVIRTVNRHKLARKAEEVK